MSNLELKIKNTVDFLKSINGKKEKIKVKFSGGKDACVLKDIILKYNDKLDFVPEFVLFSATLMSKSLRDFITTYHSEVIIMEPEKTFFDLCIENNMFPNIFNCFCCPELLNKIAEEFEKNNKIVIDGVKFSDTENNIGLEKIWSFGEGYSTHYSPLWDWTDEDIYEYININSIPLHSDYEIFNHSYGCYFCVGNIAEVKAKQLELDPELAEKLRNTASIIYNNNENIQKAFKSSEEYFQYFIGPQDKAVAMFEAV